MVVNIDRRKEEVANWVTHGIGLCLSIAGFIILLTSLEQADHYFKLLSVLIYSCSLILLYTFSTLYHAVSTERLKKKFQIADHAAIYLKIAGTYTPFLLLTIKDSSGQMMLITIWSLTLIGIILKLILGDKYNITSTIIYLGMGWLSILIIKPLYLSLPLNGFIFLTAGGLSYTIGVIFFLWEKLPYSHPIWHLFVMGGSILHYFSILLFVL